MKIAIGLPNWLPRTSRTLVPFARAAEQAGFSSLGTIGRTVFDSHEELIALAACAGATERIGLATTVAIGPIRETTLLAKQAATLDAISGGRLALGLGVGWRPDDYVAHGNAEGFARRGKAFEEQIAGLRRIWSGATLSGTQKPIGPAPARSGGPQLLIGGSNPAALERAGRLADGFLAVAPGSKELAAQFQTVLEAARAAGRKAPRLMAARYFVLGDDARARAEANVRAYYGFGGEEMVQMLVSLLLTTPEQIRATVQDIRSLGSVDELFLWTTDGDLAQIERLAKVVL